MMDIIHSGHKEAEQAEKIRHSQELRRVERLAREFALQSTIPPRTLIHPLEIPIVRSKSPHPASNQERITDFDGLEPGPDSASLIRQGTAQGRTEDLLTEDVFSHREDNVSIDEIDTLPPNMQEQLHSNWRNTPHNPAILSELDTLPTSSIQSKQTGGLPPVETQQLVAMQLPTSVRQIERPREFFLRRWGDDIRWWLLYPGRLEFLLWLIGVVVLVCLTSFFLLIITVDLRLFGSGGTH